MSYKLLKEVINAIEAGRKIQDSRGVVYQQEIGESFLNKMKNSLNEYNERTTDIPIKIKKFTFEPENETKFLDIGNNISEIMKPKHRIKEQFGAFFVEKAVNEEVITKQKFLALKEFVKFFIGIDFIKKEVEEKYYEMSIKGRICNNIYETPKHFETIKEAKSYIESLTPKYHEVK